MSNILLSPENFTLNWANLIGGVATSDQYTAPDATVSADELNSDTAGGDGLCGTQQAVNVNTSQSHILSVFALPDVLSWLRFDVVNMGALVINGYFDFANGAIGTQSVDVDDAGILGPYEGGYYRGWLNFTSDAIDGSGNVRFWLSDGDGDISVARDGNQPISIWGADLREGSGAPPDYVSQAGITISAGTRNIITCFHRTADQMIVRPRMPKPRNTLRGEFE